MFGFVGLRTLKQIIRVMWFLQVEGLQGGGFFLDASEVEAQTSPHDPSLTA